MVDAYRLNHVGLALGAGTRIIKRADVEHLDGATAILVAAEARAKEIIAEAVAIREQERQRGYAEGLKAAEVETFERLIREQAVLDAALDKSRADLTDLVLSCTRSIVAHLNPVDVAVSMTRTALGRMRREKRCQLFAPPMLAPALQARIDAILADFPEIELVDIVEDDTLVEPNVLLVSPLGRVSCSVEESLQAMEGALRGSGMAPRAAPEPAAVPTFGTEA